MWTFMASSAQSSSGLLEEGRDSSHCGLLLLSIFFNILLIISLASQKTVFSAFKLVCASMVDWMPVLSQKITKLTKVNW